ncbi:hypothetical protein Nepgr_032787 [Nepenthes gracilis]|uniref:Uncharacterized protein n=1 Tax=Nepenthes gracilis TaxID=150966 RepID=A0AAD3Y854_NEPGR|nr:hypothetical protein Nepgr_032787 [Nepenthes gracilis]
MRYSFGRILPFVLRDRGRFGPYPNRAPRFCSGIRLRGIHTFIGRSLRCGTLYDPPGPDFKPLSNFRFGPSPPPSSRASRFGAPNNESPRKRYTQ